MSEYEKIALSKDLVRRIRGLRQAPKSTRVGVAIETLDEGRRKGIANLMTYKGILKVFRLLRIRFEVDVELNLYVPGRQRVPQAAIVVPHAVPRKPGLAATGETSNADAAQHLKWWSR